MLIKPIITEKAMREAKLGRYTFAVGIGDNKTGIKREVEKAFGVKVVKAWTLRVPGKEYRMGKKWQKGTKSDWKKAIITVKEGQKINLWD
ncbi:50S ribosomal protein L23 [Candidatus Amesbacteria bacterium]|nr:50S ribosomal protein L23 [Candidatus Amesbacteria bacterium]MBI2587582.1 50S ribosomal protein L23 [Candidatus Amesbacteria bacterium]